MKKDISLYRQSYGYSCGPAALMMVMKSIDHDTALNIQLEDSVWEDANLVESKATSGQGLALAALNRGFKAMVMSETEDIPFGERLKQNFPAIDMKRMEKAFEATKENARRKGVAEIRKMVTMDDIRKEIEKEHHPILLISTRLMWEIRPIPHWIVVLEVDSKHVVIANPEHGRIERYRRKRFERFIGFDGQTCMLSVFG